MEVKMMNDLLERYLGAVCSYFMTSKRHFVYTDLKKEIQDSVQHYDDLEDLLVNYGHPRSVALSYGYRPISTHLYNPHIINLVEKILFFISGIYLFFSTLYYLQQLNCLPFQSTQNVAVTFHTSTLITWILSHPFIIMGGIAFISFIILLILDHTHIMDQNIDTSWSIEKLYALPHQSRYPHRMTETLFIFIFSIYFFIYTLIFSSDLIIKVQLESFQMIHLMTYFFQPFILIILVDYVIDMTKKTYTKKYLKYSTAINSFILIALTIFIVNSQLLKDYLLPFDLLLEYLIVNVLLIGALIMIYTIAFYKLGRNIKYYRSLFKK